MYTIELCVYIKYMLRSICGVFAWSLSHSFLLCLVYVSTISFVTRRLLGVLVHRRIQRIRQSRDQTVALTKRFNVKSAASREHKNPEN
jgi:hypothetical protein